MSFKKSVRVLVVFLGIIVLSSCTKEKAEAVQVAAEQFRVDAIAALDQINYLFLQDVSISTLDEKQQIDELIELINSKSKNQINPRLIEEHVNSYGIGEEANSITNAEFEKLKKQYFQFESMFSSLDRGSYFAKDTIKYAERHAANLTLQLINYAEILQGDFTFTSRRKAIYKRMRSAKDTDSEELQKELVKNITIEYFQLLKEEKDYKDRAIRQCYKAAESGTIVTRLIQDYDQLNISDILNMMKGSMNFAMEITNGNQNISDLKTKFEGVEDMIKANPDYKKVLDKPINKSKTKN